MMMLNGMMVILKIRMQKEVQKINVINNIKWFRDYFDYVSFKDNDGAYPDMLEYKDQVTGCSPGFHVYGVHKNTGVELDHPVLRIID